MFYIQRINRQRVTGAVSNDSKVKSSYFYPVKYTFQSVSLQILSFQVYTRNISLIIHGSEVQVQLSSALHTNQFVQTV